jgi:hypothetical protein
MNKPLLCSTGINNNVHQYKRKLACFFKKSNQDLWETSNSDKEITGGIHVVNHGFLFPSHNVDGEFTTEL